MGDVECETRGAVATIWLNRPDVRNAYDLGMLAGIEAALARVEADDATRVVVLRGRGDCFCAGADMAMLEAGVPWSELSAHVGRVFTRISEARRVTVAAVHGWAVGGGFELMLACDLAVAAHESRIGDYHIRNGLFAGAGTSYRLPRLVGLRRARELMLSGDALDGRQAEEWGLVNEVAPLDELDALVERFATRFTDRSPTIAWLTKQALNRSADAGAETASAIERLTSAVVAGSADAREGIAAFRERRAPVWSAPQADERPDAG